ncbi:MAG: CPBP family intramembrane metalloprotease [Proteobacteria bacterium]|nr:CPBP family intramembrane metalloprotease [Pseudomonadota bacterium]
MLGAWRQAGVSQAQLAALLAYHLGVHLVLYRHQALGAGLLVLGLAIFARPLGRLLDHALVGSWRVLDAEAAAERAADPPGSFDRQPLVVLVTSAVVLTLIEYYGTRGVFIDLVDRYLPTLRQQRHWELYGYVYWSGFRLCAYGLLPWLALHLLLRPGARLRDCGLAWRGLTQHLWLYVALFVFILPPIVVASFTRPFQHTYPFYDLAARSWGDFLAWELLYGAQFFALELFFRGFMIHRLKRALGSHAIFVMALPYCMIHYNKPIAEVLGAVVAGSVLGTLSLRTRSIWCGWLIHVSVAVTMDLLSLLHKTGWPGNPQFVGS